MTLPKGIFCDIVCAEIVDDGFVDFEVVGDKNYLGERSHSRGANATSIDAVMIGRKKSGERTLVMIEWKYTESYPVGDNKYIPERADIYDPLLNEPDCPIKVVRTESLYYEPFYQVMRQTLLGWRRVMAKEYGCSDYQHLHVIPDKNYELLNRVTSPDLTGDTLSDAWKGVLKNPNLYTVVSPEDLFTTIGPLPGPRSIIDYLTSRYWN